MVILKAKRVEFSYEEEKVLNGVSFDLNTGETLGLVGPNGSGKTTLMKCLNGLVVPEGGNISVQGRKLSI